MALTKFDADTPVVFDRMNLMCDEIDNQINDLKGKDVFLCTAQPGITILSQDCYTLNGMAYINLKIKKTDDSFFPTYQIPLFSSPYYKDSPTPVYCIFTDGVLIPPLAYNGGLWTDGVCYMLIGATNAKEIHIKTEVKI